MCNSKCLGRPLLKRTQTQLPPRKPLKKYIWELCTQRCLILAHQLPEHLILAVPKDWRSGACRFMAIMLPLFVFRFRVTLLPTKLVAASTSISSKSANRAQMPATGPITSMAAYMSTYCSCPRSGVCVFFVVLRARGRKPSLPAKKMLVRNF